MIQTLILLVFASLLLVSPSHAVMLDEFSTTGVVKSFDRETVTLECQSRIVKIPRNTIQEKNFKSGQTVKFTLNGKQVSEIFFAAKKPASVRN